MAFYTDSMLLVNDKPLTCPKKLSLGKDKSFATNLLLSSVIVKNISSNKLSF